MLNNINYIKITPKNKIQLILGTNGSGKSSILKEMSPLPGTPNEFDKDGYKVIEISHRGSKYICRNIFSSSGNLYSIEKDGEILYEGSVASVYKEHVYKEFGITQEIFDVVTGQNPFTSMSVSERRQWFTKISSSDYSFAIKYYNKLQENLRDSQGAVKTSQSRLVQESNKVLSKEDEEKYREQIKLCRETLEHLLNLKSNVSGDIRQYQHRLQHIEQELTKKTQESLLVFKSVLSKRHFNTEEQLISLITDSTYELGAISKSLQRTYEIIEEKQKTIHALEQANAQSVQDLHLKGDELGKQIIRFKSMLRTELDFVDAQRASQAMETISPLFREIFTSIPVNVNNKFSRSNFERANETLQTCKENLFKLENLHNEGLARKKEMEYNREHHVLNCPNCNHKWVKGYSEDLYKEVSDKIEKIVESINKNKQTKEETERYLEEANLFYQYYRSFKSLISSWSILGPFWDYLVTKDIFYQNESTEEVFPLQLFEVIKEDIEIQIHIQKVLKELDEINNLIKLTKDNSSNDLAKLKEEVKYLTLEYQKDQIKERTLRDNLNFLNEYKKAYEFIRNEQVSIESLISEREGITEKIVDINKQSILNDEILRIKTELTQYEQVVSKLDIQKALVAQLESQIQEHQRKVELYKLAVKSLSPKEGLIAKGLTGFINHFLMEMNDFIKKIWTYPLELMPISICEDDGVDLDYRFPVKVNERSEITDVAKGSSAMKEVIDLAFRIVSMKYLGLSDFPLHLDEFGARMDHTHRHTAFNVVTNLITASDFSQIYMVSHTEQSYGSMKNTDVTVLCGSNVVLPKGAVSNGVTIIK